LRRDCAEPVKSSKPVRGFQRVSGGRLGRKPPTVLSFYGHASSEDTRVLVILANSLFHSLTAEVCPSSSKYVTMRCSLSRTLTAVQQFRERLQPFVACWGRGIVVHSWWAWEGSWWSHSHPPCYVTSQRERGGLRKLAPYLHRIPLIFPSPSPK